MNTASLLTLVWPRSGAANTRLLVCPPDAWPRPQGPWARLWRRLRRQHGPLSPSQVDRLGAARREFESAVADLHIHAADALRLRMARAQSLRELWHLRAPVFDLLAHRHGQREAEARLARLNRHFPTRAPRSGFIPLEIR